ncbi:DNA adenine methylase [Achromobacter denitrificans]|uniref:DNA adenine methylase n=1 Tax=Achromobacter denitrificans TaxID=32002 RepID=UPI0020CBC4B9|nr:Dam family site-specific DNA-(adenine-N6)-methyltransferase [Achromobacter denitrificans]
MMLSLKREMATVNNTSPIFKWAGGKRWLVSKYRDLFPSTYSRLIEPFAGGAAVFFALKPERAWLNDVNTDLINAYQVISHSWEAVLSLLVKYQKKHSPEFYYDVRSSRPRTDLMKAVRFIYLNRTCFNGLYRVNLKGEFNVPMGSKTSVLLPEDNFELVGQRLKSARFTSEDFENVINQAGVGDFVFADPPYTVRHNNNGFIKYNENLFSWADQVRLRDAVFRAKKRGAVVLVSNADHECLHELYSGSDRCVSVERRSVMAASSMNRKQTTELLINI